MPKAVKKKETDRKEDIKEKFLVLIKEHENDIKAFHRRKYMTYNGCQGLLKEAIGEYNPYDSGIFKEILDELTDNGTILNIGGDIYRLPRKK